MLTTYRVRLTDGTVMTCTTLDEVRRLVVTDPDAQVDPAVHFRACAQHPAFESSNCPACAAPSDASTPRRPA